MVVAFVPNRTCAAGRLGGLERDVVVRRDRDRNFKRGQQRAPVAVDKVDEMRDCIIVSRGLLGVEAALGKQLEIVFAELFETKQRGAREQRRVHFEVGILGGGADESERAVLDRREQTRLAGTC